MYNSLAAVCEDMQSNGISVVECELKSNPSLCMEKRPYRGVRQAQI